jgi:hypothetical protein
MCMCPSVCCGVGDEGRAGRLERLATGDQPPTRTSPHTPARPRLPATPLRAAWPAWCRTPPEPAGGGLRGAARFHVGQPALGLALKCRHLCRHRGGGVIMGWVWRGAEGSQGSQLTSVSERHRGMRCVEERRRNACEGAGLSLPPQPSFPLTAVLPLCPHRHTGPDAPPPPSPSLHVVSGPRPGPPPLQRIARGVPGGGGGAGRRRRRRAWGWEVCWVSFTSPASRRSQAQ